MSSFSIISLVLKRNNWRKGRLFLIALLPLLITHGHKWIAGYRGHFTKIFDREKRKEKSSRKVEPQEIGIW